MQGGMWEIKAGKKGKKKFEASRKVVYCRGGENNLFGDMKSKDVTL